MPLGGEARRLEERKRAALIRGRIHRKVLSLESKRLDPLAEPVAAGLALASLAVSLFRRRRNG